MEKRSILLVSSAFYPEISPRSFRATELAKEFIRLGHHVVVISKHRDHDYKEFLENFPLELKMWPKSSFPNVPTFKKKPLSLVFRALARLLHLLLEYPAIEEMFRVQRMLKNEQGYDLMISFAVPYPVQWGAARAWQKVKPIASTWVADCGDPYMGDVLDSFRKPFYFAYLEKQFCRKASYISIPVESARPAYFKEFHPKIRIIPQGFDFDLSAVNTPPAGNPEPSFAYAGGFLQGIRDPSLLLRYLEDYDGPFKFHVFTSQPEAFDDCSVALKRNLVVSDYIIRKDLLKILSQMDFLINFDNNTSLNVPSKLIDYAIAGRPVLNIDKQFKQEDLFAFLNGDYTKRMNLPAQEQYHIGRVSRLFLELI